MRRGARSEPASPGWTSHHLARAGDLVVPDADALDRLLTPCAVERCLTCVFLMSRLGV